MNNLRLKKLLEIETQKPQDAFLKFAIAQEHVNDGRDGEARNYFYWLLANSPDYVPTYYHLGKLLERLNDAKSAANIYMKGVEKAQAVNDLKTAGELREALSLLEDE